MLKYLIGATLLIAIGVTTVTSFAAAFQADLVLRQGENSLSLSNSQPCKVKAVVESQTPEVVAKNRAAKLVFEGKKYDACWMSDPDGGIWAMIENGEVIGPFDPTQFMKVVKS
jgi:hypothetical protein